MSSLRAFLAGIVLTLVAVTAALLWWHLNAAPVRAPDPVAPPAKVPKLLDETQITAITLRPEAVERLALQTGRIERRRVPVSRTYGGEVLVPPGQDLLIAAPLAGRLTAPKGGVPAAGQVVRQGQAVFQLLPLLTPEGRVNLANAKIEADGLVETTQAQIEAAQVALDRAKRLHENQAGSRRQLDEAQAQSDLAKKANTAALARRKQLEKVLGELDRGTSDALAVESPIDGLLRNLSAQPGETIPNGGALFEVINLERMWVRVPVYVGDLADLDATADATVTTLTAAPGHAGLTARPVTAPPSANPQAGTVDRHFAIDNTATRYVPGHRVGVRLKLRGDEEALTVPWSAVIHDIHGGTWVYEQTAERAYNRRRVVVRSVADERAVLASGPPAGTTVVTAGAAELFGAETGFSK